MHPLMILLDVAAAVMLLLWAVRMVRTGVERAHGRVLRRMFRSSGAQGLRTAAAGTVLAVILQSSTAVLMLAAGFAASGLVPIGAGLAAVIGAGLGSALVVKVLSFDLSWLMPVLILVGATLYLKFPGRNLRQTGRIILGVGFVLMSLGMLGQATSPLRDSPALPAVVGWLSGDPVSAFLCGAAITVGIASSVGTLLLLLTLTAGGLLPMEVAAPMVFGVNFGGAVNALWITRGLERDGRIVAMGSMIVYGALSVAALAAVAVLPVRWDWLGAGEGDRMVHLHILFNLAAILLGLPFVGPIRRLASVLVPDPRAAEEAAAEARSALDPSAMATPALALASARRELLRMGEILGSMLVPVPDLLEDWRPEGAERIRRQEAEVDRLHSDVKFYLAQLGRKGLSADEARRAGELTGYAISLEHAGDLVAKSLLGLAEKKAARGLSFSVEGWQEITRLHARVQANLELALNVLISGDPASARTLAQEKSVMRDLERESHQRHLARLQSGKIESIETSGLHLEAVRALKEINSDVVTVAYPILAETGQLLPSRLAQGG